MTKLPTAETLAQDFAIVLTNWLSVTEMDEVNARNAALGENSPICASHDFCDSNEAMIQALARNGCTPAFDDEQTALINRAWGIAKAAGFDPRRIPNTGQN